MENSSNAILKMSFKLKTRAQIPLKSDGLIYKSERTRFPLRSSGSSEFGISSGSEKNRHTAPVQLVNYRKMAAATVAAAAATMANASRSAAVALSAEWAAAQRSLCSDEQQLLRVQLCPISLAGGGGLNSGGSGGGCGGGLAFGAATAAGAGVSELIAHSLWLGAGGGAPVPTASAAAADNSVSPAAGTSFASPTADSSASSSTGAAAPMRCTLLGDQPAAIAQFAFNYQSPPPPLIAARAYYPYADYSGMGGHVNSSGALPVAGWPAAAKESPGVSRSGTQHSLAISRQQSQPPPQQQSGGGGAPRAPINPDATGLLALVASTTCSLSGGHDTSTFTTAQTDRSSLRTPHYPNPLYLNAAATSRPNETFALNSNSNQPEHNIASQSELNKDPKEPRQYSMTKEEKVRVYCNEFRIC